MARKDSIGMFWEDLPPVPKSKLEKLKRQPPEKTWLNPDYLPGYEEALAFNLEIMNAQELYMCSRNKTALIFDIECYPNYFLVGFKDVENKKVFYFEMTETQPLDLTGLEWVMQHCKTVGFNSLNYDLPITALAINGANCLELKAATDAIIVDGLRKYDFYRQYGIDELEVNHIDLIEVAPLRASLKIYGGRLHTAEMQDLPFPPECNLTQKQIVCTRWYCLKNDLTATMDLLAELSEQCELREQLSTEYKTDLRSKSDAQIAEVLIAKEIHRMSGKQIKRPAEQVGTIYNYDMPDFIKFYSKTMQFVQSIVQNSLFIVEDTGSIGMPPQLSNMVIPIGNSSYKMGIGGLHSMEKSISHHAGKGVRLFDKDVISYYPFIMLNQGLCPPHIGHIFDVVFNGFVQRRLNAKKLKKKKDANSLKIVINGTFGKLGSKWSKMYAPKLLIQVTITGQLSLLMLIERLELSGIPVVSANTDGVVIKCPDHKVGTMEAIVKRWEQDTNFETESCEYDALYSRDINNYIAVKSNPEPDEELVKVKGAYSKAGLSKNPTNEICIDAIEALLTKGVPIRKTIMGCKDIRKFITVRAVKGGAVKVWGKELPKHNSKEHLLEITGFTKVEKGYWYHPSFGESEATLETSYDYAVEMYPTGKQDYLGKAIRWYYAAGEEGEIVYANNGNKVPKSDGAKPCMKLPEVFPTDIDFERYIEETERMLTDIAYS